MPPDTEFMTDILNKTIMLVLNRNWQAINIRTPADAFCQMATNEALPGPEHQLPHGLDLKESESGVARTP